MASTYSPLKIELIGTGEQTGTWGATTNVNLGENGAGLEQAIVGKANLETGDFTSNSYTLPYTNTNGLQDFRALVLDITATLSAAGTVIVPAIQKPYIILNNSVGGYAVTVKVSGQTGVSVPNGAKILVYNNGTDVGAAITHLTSLTLGTALPVASGGSGAATLTGVIKGNGTSAFTAATAGTDYAGIDTAQTFTKGQRGEITGLTDGATITPDFADSNNFSVTLAGNRTLANPSNTVAGQSGSIFITQDGTGGRTLAYGTNYDFAGGTAPTLSTTAAAVDRIDYVVRTATSIHAVFTANYS